MRTREQWAIRPLAERQIAASAWCDGWNDANEGTSRDAYDIKWPNVIEHFALDLPDTPAPADLTPWIHDAVLLADYAGHLGEEKAITDTITRARALRDAATKERP